jgi:outer membrane protein assembly factor BamB
MEKFRNNKKKTATITSILILTITATMLLSVPAANAAQIPTWSFVAAAPNPIGVNQETLICFWLNEFPPTASGDQGDRWENMTLEITAPDGSVEEFGPYQSDPVGSKFIYYTPDQIGTYYVQFTFPGQHITGLRYGQPIDTEYLPSESYVLELVVQEDPIEGWVETDVPTDDYWTRPINSDHRNWWKISGNWLMKGYDTSKGYGAQGYNPYTTAPETAHIVWTDEIYFGGLVGGHFEGNVQYYTGLSYEGKWSPPVIMQGRLYYNLPLDNSGTGMNQFRCVDIRTGETLWTQEGTISCGQLYNYDSPNAHGTHAYLWSCPASMWGPAQPWTMYDAFTGEPMVYFANTSSATLGYNDKGELIGYVLNANANWIALWNSSKALGAEGSWYWSPPRGSTVDWNAGIQWNSTIPDVPGSQSIVRVDGDLVWATAQIMNADPPTTVDVVYDCSIEAQGEQLWVENRTVMIDPGQFAGGIGPMGDGVYTLYSKERMQWFGYDVLTGEQVWGPTERYENDWGMYVAVLGGEPIIAEGKLFAQAFDGCIHCFDVTNGTELWTYYAGSAGFESPYGSYPFYAGPTVADGKVYAATGEHSPGTPLWRGEGLHCADIETGEGLWNISGWFQGPVIADGYLLTLNGADNRIYCFGKGQTATTVTASPKISVSGDKIMIEGTVLDQSPGAEGVPAMADECMTEWMEYVYMQKTMPKNAEGVEVVITTLDPNGNTYELGRTTTDINGVYGCVVEPPVPGKYQIVATFEGSESYFSSCASTYINVDEAPAPAQALEPEVPAEEPAAPEEPEVPAEEPAAPEEPEVPAEEPTEPEVPEEPTEPEPTEPTAEAPFITTEAAIMVAVAVAVVIGVAAYWQLRKRK